VSADAPILLTPGPLTTSDETRRAMLRDWGSWDSTFNAMTATILSDLVAIVNGSRTHACVPMQGSGTFAVEAALGTLVPRGARVLVPDNGAYCRRIAAILRYLGRDHAVLQLAEDAPCRGELVERALAHDPAVTHVALVHCETSAGLLNPLQEVAAVCARHGKRLIVDAMSSLGAIEIDVARDGIDVVIAASGKCLEGVPGMGFVIARRSLLEAARGSAHSLALDLYDQWTYMERTSRWRFTPPTHVVAALRSAIDQLAAEGGTHARGERYRRNLDALVAGMSAHGLRLFLRPEVQAPIIASFHVPHDAAYAFKPFYERVRAQGYVLYPGKLTRVETFRVGCIGAIDAEHMRGAVTAMVRALDEMGVRGRETVA
jgi:2-aminoethylphosphonate-pyruvate transaminase